ncbi:hypothetical protein B296_00046897 [Ensete ventricosum]|uniref:Uncharacterized protein n=1 Tax=Ensete ventricosum TaxID=4639 RepID=A0A426XJV5_ENSVE|nr:hypothetical protein B296_00046897 [Ensete ventricosum]
MAVDFDRHLSMAVKEGAGMVGIGGKSNGKGGRKGSGNGRLTIAVEKCKGCNDRGGRRGSDQVIDWKRLLQWRKGKSSGDKDRL